MPISVLGHRESNSYPNGISINTTYSNFVRMMSLFYDENDFAAITKRACEDATALQEKMLLLDEYTGTN